MSKEFYEWINIVFWQTLKMSNHPLQKIWHVLGVILKNQHD